MYPNNDVHVNNVYPTYSSFSGSVGNFATNPETPMDGNVLYMNKGQSDTENAVASGFGGSPAVSWLSLAFLLVVLMFFAQRYDGGGNYSNLKLSAYNIFTVSLASIIGISLFKVASTKFPRPLAGVATVIQAV